MEIEKKTTTIIVDKDQLDTLIIALNDCYKACTDRIEDAKPEAIEEILLAVETKFVNTGLSLSEVEKKKEEVKKVIEDCKALAEFTLNQIPGILEEIKEVYPELEEAESHKIITDLSKISSIPKPNW